MRFKSEHAKNQILRERVGEQRIVRKFCLFPRQFGKHDLRVFEYAYILEEVQLTGMFLGEPRVWNWVEIDFVDNVEIVLKKNLNDMLKVEK